jgi:hypothetical protein
MASTAHWLDLPPSIAIRSWFDAEPKRLGANSMPSAHRIRCTRRLGGCGAAWSVRLDASTVAPGTPVATRSAWPNAPPCRRRSNRPRGAGPARADRGLFQLSRSDAATRWFVKHRARLREGQPSAIGASTALQCAHCCDRAAAAARLADRCALVAGTRGDESERTVRAVVSVCARSGGPSTSSRSRGPRGRPSPASDPEAAGVTRREPTRRGCSSRCSRTGRARALGASLCTSGSASDGRSRRGDGAERAC